MSHRPSKRRPRPAAAARRPLPEIVLGGGLPSGARQVPEDPSYKVAKLRAGTVVDHLRAGSALRCLSLLGAPGDGVVTVGVNLPSRKLGHKDILKIENRVLSASELARLALLAPRATVVVIEDYRVVRKIPLVLPTAVDGVVRCPNPSCVTRHDPVVPRVRVEAADPVRLRCHYCERRIRYDEVEFLPGPA